MFVTAVFEGIRSGVCECVYRKRFVILTRDRKRLLLMGPGGLLKKSRNKQSVARTSLSVRGFRVLSGFQDAAQSAKQGFSTPPPVSLIHLAFFEGICG
jgi:hypothetical protein